MAWSSIANLLNSAAARSAFALVALLAAAQLLSITVFTIFVMWPQAERLTGIIAQNVIAIAETSDRLSPADQAAFMKRLSGSPYLRIHAGLDHWPEDSTTPSILETLFLNELAKRLEANKDFEWRRGTGGRLWIALNIGSKRVWLSTRAPEMLQPEAALLVAAIGSIGLAAFAGLYLQHLMSQSLLKLTAAAQRVSLGTTAERVPSVGPQEFRDLADSFNRMTERLAAAERERNLMLAGISHDLRTPLAKVRLAVEMLDGGDDNQDLRATIIRQTETMDAMLAQFLDFARGIDQEPRQGVEVASLVADAVAVAGVPDVRISHSGASIIQAKPMALRRALVNLITNAARYGQAPFVIDVSAADGACRLCIRDHGPGLSAEDQSHLKEPFVRGDAARSGPGTGLGLAIVDQVARAHGGQLELANADGGGLAATIVLPA